MTVPETKAQLLAAIQKEYQKLMDEISLLPANKVLEASMDGHVRGHKMSPHNLVAYLLGWNELVLKWYAKMDAGESVDFPETGFKWNQLGQLAEKFYQDYECLPFALLVARLDNAKQQIIELVKRHDDDTLYACPWYGKWSSGRMIQFNTSSPYANARNRLRKWRCTYQNTPSR